MQPRGGFSPASLFSGGVQGFVWDASAAGALFQERTGASATTAASATTDPVGSVKDFSGNGNWFTVPTSDTKRPLLNITGGLYSLTFDGTDDEANCATAALLSVLDDKDFFVGFATSNVNASERIFFSTLSNVNIGIPASQGDLMSFRYSLYFNAGSSQTTQVAGAHVWSWNAASASMSCYRDGSIQGSAVSITGSVSGSSAYVGSRGGSLYCGAKIYRAIVCGRSLTAPELASATTWLGAGAGLTL